MIVALSKIYEYIIIDLIRLLFLLVMHTKGTLYLTLYFVFSALLKHQKYKYVILRNPNVNNFFAKRYPLVSPPLVKGKYSLNKQLTTFVRVKTKI